MTGDRWTDEANRIAHAHESPSPWAMFLSMSLTDKAVTVAAGLLIPVVAWSLVMVMWMLGGAQ